MEEITNAVIVERIDNFRTAVNARLKSIEAQVKLTNGKVAENVLKIKGVEDTQKNCISNQENTKDWIKWLPSGIMVLLTIANIFI